MFGRRTATWAALTVACLLRLDYISSIESTPSNILLTSDKIRLEFNKNHVPETLIITVDSTVPSIEINRLHDIDGIQWVRKLRGRTSAKDRFLVKREEEGRLSLSALAELYSQSNFVESVSLDYIAEVTIIPNDDKYSELWGMNQIQAPNAWDKRTSAERIVVAVLDTGLDYNHPDLISNIWNNQLEIPGDGIDNDKNGYIDDVIGWNFVDNNSDPIDDHDPIYHGTHVAGIIGAEGNNELGIAGVAWRTQIMPIKVLDNEGAGSVSNLIEGIEYAVENGADVINMCFGGLGKMPDELHASLELARSYGVIAVVAAGNNGVDIDRTTFWPGNATLENIVTVVNTNIENTRPQEKGVGMTLVSNEEATYWTWGKRYKTNYGRFHTDISAPGTNILSTARFENYQILSGTSMATPHVTGAIALTWSEYYREPYSNIIDRVLGNVDSLPDLKDNASTEGRLNLNSCFNGITHITQAAVRGIVGPGNEKLIQGFTVTGKNSKKIVITSAGPSLYSILGNQVAADPSISLFGPNGLIATNNNFGSLSSQKLREIAHLSATPMDTKESAIVENLEPGVYTIVMTDLQDSYKIGIINLFESENSDVDRFAGSSARLIVGKGDQVGILSFFISGKGKRRVLIKTNGPSLSDFGIEKVLSDPKVSLYKDSILIDENDNWKDFDGTQNALEEELEGRGITIPSERDALLYENLSPGLYSIIVETSNSDIGVCLLEVIEYR